MSGLFPELRDESEPGRKTRESDAASDFGNDKVHIKAAAQRSDADADHALGDFAETPVEKLDEFLEDSVL